MLKGLLKKVVKWYVSFFGDDRMENRQETIQAITTDGQGNTRGTQRTSKKGTRGQAEKLVLVSPEEKQRSSVRRMTWQEMRDNMRAYDEIRAVLT